MFAHLKKTLPFQPPLQHKVLCIGQSTVYYTVMFTISLIVQSKVKWALYCRKGRMDSVHEKRQQPLWHVVNFHLQYVIQSSVQAVIFCVQYSIQNSSQCLKSWFLQLETKKNVFFSSVLWFSVFFLKYLPHFWQCFALTEMEKRTSVQAMPV